MSITRYKAIISDIDGTLTAIDPYALPSKRVIQSIQTAVSQGLLFALASGRPFFLVKPIADCLGHLGPCIVDNGAAIVQAKDGEVLWEAVLPFEQANKILALTKNFGLVRASTDQGGIDSPTQFSADSKIYKLSVHDITLLQAEKLIDEVTTEFKDVASVKAASYEGDHLVDVYFSDIHATKQHAVVKLAEILGLACEEMIGIGDGYNDFPLLMACGLKVAMGNAVPELKAIADYIAPSVADDGIVTMVEKFILNSAAK